MTDVDDDNATARPQLKQVRRDSGELDEQPLQKAGYLIIHSAYYLDTPRLFANDSKAEGLRGVTPVPDLERFLEDNIDYDFVVEKEYDCEAYCRDHETDFQSIGNSRLRSRISESERAYLFTLTEDLPLATPSSESITHFTPNMAEALNALDNLCQWDRIFDPSDDLEEVRLEAPYTNIYHSRKLLDDYKNKDVDPVYWSQIDAFQDYVLGAMSTDYVEADALFEKSEITLRHFAKLFRKGDIVVMYIDNERVGLLCESIDRMNTWTQRLTYQSWEFDGLFQKKFGTLQVAWPSHRSADDTTSIPITSLSAFPVQFGDPELKQSLKTRGLMLWDCRFGKYVSYEAPTPTPELQKVGKIWWPT
ncbi:hypothetical protein D6C78_01455 [Aureobasidium pullulans]|uniref:Uncharacterized protein n=1 Tax=Aureobasidium pullulans TaxID=5580 RepID=A0A4T0C3D3_AURPU|nr:hypothetical protein D6C78_01455 [Aureobasidium pullulans]